MTIVVPGGRGNIILVRPWAFLYHIHSFTLIKSYYLHKYHLYQTFKDWHFSTLTGLVQIRLAAAQM